MAQGRALDMFSQSVRSLAPLPCVPLAAGIGGLVGGPACLDLVRRSRRLLALCGAGLSTSSGIPDYRSPGRAPYKPLQHAQFVSDEVVRRRYWARSFMGWPRMARAMPSAGHRALAQLERLGGRAVDVITQNVDGLHALAGSTRVLELHGSLATASCLACGARESREALQQRMASQNRRWAEHFCASAVEKPDGDSELPPHAHESFVPPRCGACAGALKPDVTFHGGSVPQHVTAAATRLVESCDALLVVGSTATTWSAFRLARRASERGVPVCVLNHGATRVDALAALRIDAEIGTVLTALVTAL